MKNSEILIIGRDFHPDGKETAALIADALTPHLSKLQLQSDLVLFKDLVFDISTQEAKVINPKNGRDLASYKAVLMTNWFSHASVRKDIAHALAAYFNYKGVKFLNSEALYSRSTSKLSQMMTAALNDVQIPHTIFSLSTGSLKEYLKQCNFKPPFIFKDAQASRGKSNFILDSIDDINRYKDKHSEKTPFIVQELIKSDNYDLRFFVAGGGTQLIIKRIGNQDSHLNNTSVGAKTELIPVGRMSKEVLKDVHTMSNLLHRELTGIDIMFDRDTGQHYFLEANPIPQIATGSNVDLKLDAVARTLKKMTEGEN